MFRLSSNIFPYASIVAEQTGSGLIDLKKVANIGHHCRGEVSTGWLPLCYISNCFDAGWAASILLPCLVLSITVKKASREMLQLIYQPASALMYADAAFPQIGSYATFSPYIAIQNQPEHLWHLLWMVRCFLRCNKGLGSYSTWNQQRICYQRIGSGLHPNGITLVFP